MSLNIIKTGKTMKATLNPLTKEQMAWVAAHELFFKANNSLHKDAVPQFWAIYSWVSGKNQKPTNCGRCVATGKLVIYTQYQKQLEENDFTETHNQ